MRYAYAYYTYVCVLHPINSHKKRATCWLLAVSLVNSMVTSSLPSDIVAACAPGLDCSYSYSCPHFISACPSGYLCNSYEGIGNSDASLLERADKSYVKYKFQGVFGGLPDDIDYKDFIEDGRYVQAWCIRGFYCPDSMSVIKCPAGNWCSEGVKEPLPCDVMSVCPSGTYFQVNFMNFLIACLSSIILLSVAFMQRKGQRKKEGESREMTMIASITLGNQVSPETYNDTENMKELKYLSSHLERSGIELKFRNILATSRDLNYSDDDTVIILDNISGELEAGKVSGILGPSGCGKSSLISILRSPVHVHKGSRQVVIHPDRKELSPLELPKRIGYVPQEDIVDRQCTVRELLKFNCLARAKGINKEDMEGRIDSVMRDLQIRQIADTVIGGSENSNANISGGQVM